MAYLILPPLLIILGIATLLYIFSRKAGRIASLPGGTWKKSITEKKSLLKRFFSYLGNFFLKLLERLSQKTKILFLKLHNRSNSAFHKIRERRKLGESKKTEEIQEEVREKNIPAEATFVKKVFEEPKIEKKETLIFTEEKSMEPIISQEAAQPETKGGKSEYEEALIERIALNPKDIEAYERLGDYYIEAKNYTDAKQCLEQVLVLNPGYRRAKLKLRRIEKILKVGK